MSSEILPSFIKLIDLGNGTGFIRLIPGYLDAGNYSDIVVSVWDSGTPRMVDQTTFNVTVQNINLPPIANASSNIQSGTPPMDVDFSGQASMDLDGTIQSYQWNLGDGNIRTTRDVSHTYQTAGKFYVILTVTDFEMATDSDTLILINNPDLTNLYISEVSYAEATTGEFLEIYNKAPYAIKLSEFKLIKIIAQGDVQYIFDFGMEERQAESTTIVPANQFLIIGKDVPKSTFADYWDLSSETFFYNSGSDALISGYAGNRWQLRYLDGTINQNNGTLIDDTEQVVAGFQNRSYQNVDGSWVHNISHTGATPGYIDNDQSLPIELMVFTAVPTENSISLKWETGSEMNNLGFNILRSISKDGLYEMIASYQTDINLKGQGNSPTEKKYQFTDWNVEKNVTYWYKLVDLDFSGVETQHGPILGKIAYIADNLFQINYGDIPQQYMLYDNFPNPFNMTTSIQIDIPDNDFSNEIISINIFNVLGKKVSQLYHGPLSAGKYRLHWDGKNDSGNDMASGLYILSFQSQSYISSKKMILIR
jgi:PKD repeat protein